VVLQSLHNLSDEQTEYLIRDRVRVATDAVESGGIGIIVPISGNHVFPLVAHPVFVDFRC
jgi:hypothetical protein